MTVRLAVLCAALAAATSPAAAQVIGARRVQPKAFPLAVSPWIALGFGGVRATADDPGQVTCVTQLGADCFDYKVGSGPLVGVDVQIPVSGTFGLQLGASAGRPSRVVCTRGAACRSTDDMTLLRGSAVILMRIKARAPIYFGIGGAYDRIDPGPVEVLQPSMVSEVGGVGIIGYDFAMSSRIGGRVTWTHYLMRPSSDNLSGDFRATGLAHDWLVTVGARIAVGS